MPLGLGPMLIKHKNKFETTGRHTSYLVFHFDKENICDNVIGAFATGTHDSEWYISL
jgi:hypothetical protein